MSLVDFIGFIVTMVLMFFIILRRVWQERRQQDQKAKPAQEATLKKFLKELDIDMQEDEEEEAEEQEEVEHEPPPKPIILQPHRPLQQLQAIPKVESYQTIIKERESKASRMINQLPSRKQMVVYQEIMNPPVSRR